MRIVRLVNLYEIINVRVKGETTNTASKARQSLIGLIVAIDGRMKFVEH